jgi:hypothetical protein
MIWNLPSLGKPICSGGGGSKINELIGDEPKILDWRWWSWKFDHRKSATRYAPVEQPLKNSLSSQQLCGVMDEHGDRRVICTAAVEPNFISTHLMMSQKILRVGGWVAIVDGSGVENLS